MFLRRSLALAAILFVASGTFHTAQALQECRLLRQPDIEGNWVVFGYAGDLWRVPRTGGEAMRLTSHEGLEIFPKLSPDGRMVAFTAEYDGNQDAYVMPLEGGEPRRLTWHPSPDQVAEWYPDGKSILLRSIRNSAPQRYTHFFKIPAAGGFEQELPLPTAGYCTFSPDGNQLAYVSPAYDNRTWKRYRGGNAPDIWIYNFKENKSEKITDWAGPDEWPMWHDKTIYYCSDRDGRRQNIWAYDTEKKTHRQVTTYKDYDVKWPSVGSDAMVFENGGYLYVMDLPSEKVTKIQVMVPDDKPATRAEFRNVSQWIAGADISPSAKRAVFEARGDIFTVPAEKGDVRNLTQTPGVHERAPEWSPDGKWIAYFSDKSGEFEIHVCGSDGKIPDRQVTHGIGTYPFDLHWSPDSKKIALSDRSRKLWWTDAATGSLHSVDQGESGEIHQVSWSPDSRWLAYTLPGINQQNRVMLHSLDSGKSTPISNGMDDDSWPSFDSEGKYLYFVSSRTFNPKFGNLEFNYLFPASDKLYAVTLRDSVSSPVPYQSDEETGDSGSGAKGGAAAAAGAAGPKGVKPDAAPAPPAVTRIDLAGISGRVSVLPVKAGSYAGLTAWKGKLLYLSIPTGDAGGPGPQNSLMVFDLEKRESKAVLSGISSYSANKDGAKVLYHAGPVWGITDAAEGKKVGDGKIESGNLMALVDPHQEWNNIFSEAWRLERDFYYDPKMGGLDWKAVGESYRQLLPYVAHRADLNYILGELIGELSTSHTYVQGGDLPAVPKVGVGLLGCDFELDASSGLYKFKKIYREPDWNSEVSAPLGEPGVMVKEGDYLLSVNGQKVAAPMNVYAAFTGTAGKQVALTVGSGSSDPKPRTYMVKAIDNEVTLRYTAWVNSNREKVSRLSGGRVAYIHVPNTAIEGIQEFSKQFYPQVDKDAIVVDERFNAGGFIPDFFVEKLGRTTISHASRRDGGDFRTPATALDGPKCILINQYAGSGGDAFPYYFRLKGLGPVIGERTWGGLVGISHGIPLMDGGSVTMPEFGIWGLDGKWTAENHGVDPDIEVENTPDSWVSGHDLQLERAVQYCLDEMKKNPKPALQRPAYPIQKVMIDEK